MQPLSKQARRRILLELLRSEGAPTQAEIQAAFRRRGYQVSQITVSRDLRELGAVKAPGEGGRRYALSAPAPGADEGSKRLERALREFVRSMEAAGQFVVLKTSPSGAPPVALSLDEARLEGLVGTIAGDDTVFALARGPREARELLRRLNELAA